MQLTSCNGLVLCLSDFNAETRLARNPPTVVGPHGSGTDNDNSRRLLDFCINANLHICGSWFRRKNIHTGCLMITKRLRRLVNRRWNVIMNNVEFIENRNSDHRPLIATCRIKLKKAVLHQPTKFTIRCFQAPYTWCRISISGGYPEQFYGSRW